MVMSVDTVIPIDDDWHIALLGMPGVGEAFADSFLRPMPTPQGTALTSYFFDVELEFHREGNVLSVIKLDRGRPTLLLRTNNIAAAAVFGLKWRFGGLGFRGANACDFSFPTGFIATDEGGGAKALARISWGNGQWVEIPSSTSLFDGLRWSHFARNSWDDLAKAAMDPARSPILIPLGSALPCDALYQALLGEPNLTTARLQEMLTAFEGKLS